MNEGKTIQAVFSAFLAVISSYFGVLVVPLIILTLVMIIDYATGMTSAWEKKELSSKKGINGIIKKVSYFALVAVGMVMDWVILSVLERSGIHWDMQYLIGLTVTCWLIINELISILENLGTIGVPLPKFLIKIARRLKSTVEKTADSKVPQDASAGDIVTESEDDKNE